MARMKPRTSMVTKLTCLIVLFPFNVLLLGKTFAVVSGMLLGWDAHDQVIGLVPIWVFFFFSTLFLSIYLINEWYDQEREWKNKHVLYE